MGYYDCKDCGNPLGQEYGFCSKCTPMEWIQFNSNLYSSKRCASFEIPFISNLSEALFLLRNYDSYVHAVEEYNKHRPLRAEEHIILTKEQVQSEIRKYLDMINEYVTIEIYK